MSLTNDPYLELAAAIIKAAIEDYQTDYRYLLKHPDCIEAKEAVREGERFFRSEWFETLSDLDGPTLLKAVKARVREEESHGVYTP